MQENESDEEEMARSLREISDGRRTMATARNGMGGLEGGNVQFPKRVSEVFCEC